MVINHDGERRYLSKGEQWVAATVGALLIALALLLVILPPNRTEAVDGCSPTTARKCTISVDGDSTVFAGIVAALGGAALLVGLLGIRFSSIEAAGVKLGGQSFDDATKGLAPAEQASAVVAPATPTDAAPTPPPAELATSGEPVVLPAPMAATETSVLDEYRYRVYRRNRDVFLAHLLAPPTQPGQTFRVAVFLTGHGQPVTAEKVTSAVIYFGPHWGSRRYTASWSPDGKLGVVTEAYGPFLALCEVTFADGARILMHHYVDFEMGVLFNDG